MLYVTGEESLQQLALRARGSALPAERLSVARRPAASHRPARTSGLHPRVAGLLDSIQVMQLEAVGFHPGQRLRRCARPRRSSPAWPSRRGTVVMLVGHVTKEGSLAGPKVLEHMIDCFMMLDSPAGSRYRTLRGLKNRFGEVNELGVFAMTEQGMKEVANPSAIFLSRGEELAHRAAW